MGKFGRKSTSCFYSGRGVRVSGVRGLFRDKRDGLRVSSVKRLKMVLSNRDGRKHVRHVIRTQCVIRGKLQTIENKLKHTHSK